MIDFSTIQQFPQARYNVSVPWSDIEFKLNAYNDRGVLELDPPFQRLHVWTIEQQRAYVEFKLKGGTGSDQIYFSQSDWGTNYKEPMYLVDGKQRLEAIRAFMRGDLAVFGALRSEITGLHVSNYYMYFNVASLKTRKEVINWYLGINVGGSVHTQEEIEKARALLDQEF